MREEGFYFVRTGDVWEVNHWNEKLEYWDISNGLTTEVDKDFSEIDERPIIHHTKLPKAFNVKIGNTLYRHLLENYYVALPSSPMPNAKMAEWVMIEKGVSMSKIKPMIDMNMAIDKQNPKWYLRNPFRLDSGIPDFIFDKILFPAFLVLAAVAVFAIFHPRPYGGANQERQAIEERKQSDSYP